MTYGKKLAVFVAACSLVLAQFGTAAFAATTDLAKQTVPTTAGQKAKTPETVTLPGDSVVDAVYGDADNDSVIDAVYGEDENDVVIDPKVERKAAIEQKIAEVKAEARAHARAERAAGFKGSYLVYVNGERLNITPLSRSGRTLVPFRRLAEFLGAEVSWEPNTRTVTMVKGDQSVSLVIGASTALVNGEEVTLQVPSEIVESSTFVPLRFISEALGANVDYDAETGAITVIDGEAVTPEQPATEQPATEQPATEQPATEQPATEQPATEQPATEQPATSTGN